MALKIGSWLVGVGCCLAFAGLCFLPAAYHPNRDAEMLTAGAMLFSAGMVLAACGMYVKARYWAETAPRSEAKRGQKICEMCSKREAVIQCRVHQMQLCSNCVGTHYDFRSCAYVPTTPSGNSKTRARSRASNA